VPTLSDYDLEVLFGGFAVLAMYGFAAFWAFNIRKGLTVKLYRNQALGIGLVGIGLAYFSYGLDGLVSLLPTASLGNLGNSIGFALFFFTPLPLFYWTSQSLQAARQSDPLERDQFHWSRVRIVLWMAIFIALTIIVVYDFLDISISSIPAFVELGVPLVSAAILLPFARRRSSDITFRRHLKWFGLAAISLLLSIVWLLLFASISGPCFLTKACLASAPLIAFISSGGQFILLLISGYFLYRSVRSIVPLYSFTEKIETK